MNFLRQRLILSNISEWVPGSYDFRMEKAMRAKQIIGATVELIIKVMVFAAIIMFVLNTSVKAYDYGYRVFAEEPVSVGEGRNISVIVEKADSVKDIGQMLQEKGLIRDAGLFTMQEFLSEQHGKIQPGVYDLNTSMTSQEMLAVMAAEGDVESTEDTENIPDTGLVEDTESVSDAGSDENSGETENTGENVTE